MQLPPIGEALQGQTVSEADFKSLTINGKGSANGLNGHGVNGHNGLNGNGNGANGVSSRSTSVATSGYDTPRSRFSAGTREDERDRDYDYEYEEARDKFDERGGPAGGVVNGNGNGHGHGHGNGVLGGADEDEYRGRVMYRRDRRAPTATMDVDG